MGKLVLVPDQLVGGGVDDEGQPRVEGYLQQPQNPPPFLRVGQERDLWKADDVKGLARGRVTFRLNAASLRKIVGDLKINNKNVKASKFLMMLLCYP